MRLALLCTRPQRRGLREPSAAWGKAGLGEPRAAERDLELRCVDKEELARCGVCVLWGAALNLLTKREFGHGAAFAKLFLMVWREPLR